jgi:hypothetical protein
MGNTQRPARKQFADLRFAEDDSLLDLSQDKARPLRRKFASSPDSLQRSTNDDGSFSADAKRHQRPEYFYHPNEFKVLPEDLFERKDSFQEIFKKRSKKDHGESLSQPSLTSARDLLRLMTFVQTSITLLLPDASYIEEACDAYMLKTACLEGTKSYPVKSSQQKGRAPQTKKVFEEVIQEEDESQDDDHEFLRQLKGTAADREPVSPLNLSTDEPEITPFDAKPDAHTDIAKNRFRVFAQYTYEDDAQSLEDLLSPIKPLMQPPKVATEAVDRGSLDVFVKPKQSIHRSQEAQVPSTASYHREANHQTGNPFKHKYFNKSPFETLFQNLTNTPALEGKRLMECLESEGHAEKEASNQRSHVHLPPTGKENRSPNLKPGQKSAQSKEKQTTPKVICVDLRDSAASQRRESLGRDSKSSKPTKSYKDIHARDLKPSTGSHKTGNTQGKLNVQKARPEVREPSFHEDSHREVWVAPQTDTPKNTTRPSDHQQKQSLSSYLKPDYDKKQPKTANARNFTLEEHEDFSSAPQQRGMLEDPFSQSFIRRDLTIEEEAHLRSQYFAGRQPYVGKTRTVYGGSCEGETGNGQTESRHEMARLMQSYQIDSAQKQSGSRSQQSDSQPKRFGVNIHKLSQQAMMELQDFE